MYHVIVLMEVLSDCLSFQKMVRTKPLRVVPMSPTIDSTSQRNLIGCLLPPKLIHYNLNYVTSTKHFSVKLRPLLLTINI